MKDYAWAQNKQKLERALGELGPDADEKDVKARYIEMAGFVLTDAGEAPETKEEKKPVVEEESSEEKPKKKK